MGPSVILDKSALEALSVDESVWLEALLDVNVVPVFYVEVLADLEKQGRHGQSPEAAVGRLAEKTPSNAYPNVHHRQMLRAELAGRRIDMTRRPVISGGDVRRAADGKVGLHVDEFPEQTALWRWQRHDFEAGPVMRARVAVPVLLVLLCRRRARSPRRHRPGKNRSRAPVAMPDSSQAPSLTTSPE